MLSRLRSCVLLVVVVAVLAPGAACKRQHDESPCSAVAGRLLAVAQTETQRAQIAEVLRQRVAMQLPALRDAVEESCTAGRWPVAVRTCMVQATDGAALAACQRVLTEEQRTSLRRATGDAAAP